MRNSRLFVSHVLVLATTIWVFKNENTFPLVIVFCSLIARIFLLKKNRKPTLSYTFFAALTGLGWGVFYSFVYRQFGLTSIQSMATLGVIVIMLSGGVTSLSAHLPSCYAYFISLVAVPVRYFFTDPSDQSYLLGLLTIGTLVYHFFHAKISHNLMKKLLVAEQDAHLQLQNMQEFINAIPGLVAVIDKNEKFSMVNNNFDGFFKEVVGKDLSSFYPDSEITQCLLQFLRSDEHEIVRELSSSVDGRDSWYMVHLRRLKHPVDGIVAAIQPITELIKAKNDLRIQESRTQYTARLVSLGEFSAGIAHEVNNPLTIIEGSVSLMKVLLEDKELDRSALNRAATKISETTNRIAKIIKSLRTLSGNADEEPFTNVTFQSIVDPALEICQPKLISHDIKLTVQSPPEKISLFGNEVQLSQVIMNLISNAIDAVKEKEGERWIQIHYRANAEWIDILVIDSGDGVDEMIRAKIMDPFFTTKVSHQGTGLGLSISKSIIESHQGSLSLLPDTKHTTFRMRFPRMNPWIKKTETSEGPISVPE